MKSRETMAASGQRGTDGTSTTADPSVRQRLQAIIHERKEDYAGLSRLIGRNPAYIQQFITRGVPRKLAEDDRRILAAHLGVPETELGGPPPSPASAHPSGTGDRATGDYHLIPFLGHTGRREAETPLDAFAFEAGFLRDLGDGRLDTLSAVRVGCDLMAPTLMAGDQLIIDAASVAPVRDGLHVLRVAGALAVRRVAVHPASHRLSLIADNRAYPPVTDCDPESLSLVGRIVWIGRKLG